ncbi:bifunctional diaminohydroxyphosphoribosylaminopyrimidine deaminase/5-amino-6-(5-phosphoribosylamino)uracil reductase RibD [Winogradskyella poriferorum]|uniref:bifunctional diaminohydroxyphosphoribosylaminopyrimidine deaminase/5-amino-6-(5-phosphoribosylamino)uracil reductase RibD n=1 Tax=Winogradskyella poriferorum TaxID=307627 RepID=UPI003D657252
MNKNAYYINRCLQIASNGLGTTRPNPMVGAVVVYEDKIIGEGFTSIYGGPHAEVIAIRSVKDKSLLKKSTLYVILEPCSHHGKTPPCSDLIIKHNIPKVVIGCVDDNPEVAGQGIAKLRKSGCDVIVGVLEKECKYHHRRFFTFHNKKRPYVILKWAETSDGFIAPIIKDEKKPVWITNKYSRQLVHKWRAEEQAILVGANTVIEDNPSLTVRDWIGENPTRIVLDKNLSLSKDYSVFKKDITTIIISEKDIDFNQSKAHQIANFLHASNINSVIIEGGAKTLQTFIDNNLWDEARIFVGKTTFCKGVKAPHIEGALISETYILEDRLSVYSNKKVT